MCRTVVQYLHRIIKSELRLAWISGIMILALLLFATHIRDHTRGEAILSYISEFFHSIVDCFSTPSGSSESVAALSDASTGGSYQLDSSTGAHGELGASATSTVAEEPDYCDFSANSTATPFQIAAEASSITACTSTTEMFGSFDSGISSSSSWDSGSSWGSGSSFGGSSFD
jgi:hypothetical protein